MRGAPFIIFALASCGGRLLDEGSDASDAGHDVAVETSALDVTQEPVDEPAPTPTCGVDAPLLAYFPLDTDTKDHSGNGNDASGTGLTAVAGIVGGAMRFDGSSSSLHVSTGSDYLQGPRTLCAWIEPQPTSGLAQPIFFGGAPSQGDFFSVSAATPSGGTCPFLPPNQPFVDHWGTPCFSSPAVVTLGSWNLVCFGYGQGTIRFAADGVVAEVGGALYDYPLATLFIGSTSAAGTTTASSFAGSIDEVTVWGTELGASAVGTLYAHGAGCAAK